MYQFLSYRIKIDTIWICGLLLKNGSTSISVEDYDHTPILCYSKELVYGHFSKSRAKLARTEIATDFFQCFLYLTENTFYA